MANHILGLCQMSLSVQDFSLLANQLTRIVLEAHVNGILIHSEVYQLLIVFGRQSREYRTVAVRLLNEGAVSVDSRIVKLSLEGLDQLRHVLYTEEIVLDRKNMAAVLTGHKESQVEFKPLNLSAPVEPVPPTKPMVITPQAIQKHINVPKPASVLINTVPVMTSPSVKEPKSNPSSPLIPAKRPLTEKEQDSSDEDIDAMELTMEADTDEE
jgi:predicted HTH domain antitoxin